ncbi:MAG: DUF6036 family nucleotidyltransferase [Solirubrobacteraceae bacterium]
MPERGRARFTRAEIVEALRALGRELSSRGVHAQVFIVGGAAMALAYSTRRVTRDVDAVFEPKAIVYEAAEKVAEELSLPADWLNDGAKAFMPGVDGEAQPLPEVEGVEVSTASPRYLLAMKLMAMRFGEDDEDIELLLEMLDVKTPDEALAILRSLYPALEPPPKTRFFLEELLGGGRHAKAK